MQDNHQLDYQASSTATSPQGNGFYRLSWLQRIGFGAGDLAQNLIYQTICMYLLFFYTDVYVLGGDAAKAAGLAGTMFLVVRIVDVLWDPLVGTFVDKHNPKWGKYRSYLIMGGIPLTILAILCFWDGFKPSIIYAYITYVGMSMLYTLINVPYGALNSSLTRDTDEITILTSTRMFMANVGGLCVSAGVPILVAVLAGAELPLEMALFMGLGSLPSFIFMPLVPAIKRKVGKKNMLYIFLSIAIIGMALLYIISRMGTVKENITLVYIAQFIKSTGVIVATGYMWALIPEVISYGEWKTGRRISGIVNALTGLFFKAGMTFGSIVGPAVLAYVGYNSKVIDQTPLAEEGILWLVCVIPAILLMLAMFIISKYELSDEKIDQINKEIEERHMNAE